MNLIVSLIGILVIIFLWGTIFYYIAIINKYRKLADIERKKLRDLGIYIDQSPFL